MQKVITEITFNLPALPVHYIQVTTLPMVHRAFLVVSMCLKWLLPAVCTCGKYPNTIPCKFSQVHVKRIGGHQ